MKSRTTPGPVTPGGHPSRALELPAMYAGGLAGMSFIPMFRDHAVLFPTVMGAAAFLILWGAVLFATAARSGRTLALETVVKKPHWVQACAQVVLFLYWGWHARTVYTFFPFILAQLLFAYGVDALLCWSRRDTYRLGFGPVPIVLSINLFLLFRPSWFYWQFVLIVVGYLGKELIRWRRDGRSAHIFNPSSFPLGLTALILLITGGTDVTLGSYIAQTQTSTPGMYLVIFLVSLPGQILFGVARMTLSAVVSMVLISGLYLQITGIYMFRDAFITVPVFLGMHLLFTDPSTSPRTEGGQVVYGMLYALGVTGFYFLLEGLGLPAFYEKLLPVPLMNLMVRRIDIIARSEAMSMLDPARIAASVTPLTRNVAYTSGWVGLFLLFSGMGVVGDSHPGQYYPFWQQACEAGNTRACQHQAFMTYNYCNRGSAWACNEYGIYLAGLEYSTDARAAFRQACEGDFEPGCENARAKIDPATTWVRAEPRMEDLPIVLRGSKGPVRERDPTVLMAMACEQGWPLCEEGATD